LPSTPPVATPAKSNGTGETISVDKLKTSYVTGLEEYVVNGNAAEIGTELKSLIERFDPAKARKILVSLMVERIIEKKEDERQALMKLMPLLVTDGVLSSEDVVDALKESLEFLNDIMIDSPKAGVHVANLLNKCVESGALSVQQVVFAISTLQQESPEGTSQLVGELKKVFSPENGKQLEEQVGGGGGEERQ